MRWRSSSSREWRAKGLGTADVKRDVDGQTTGRTPYRHSRSTPLGDVTVMQYTTADRAAVLAKKRPASWGVVPQDWSSRPTEPTRCMPREGAASPQRTECVRDPKRASHPCWLLQMSSVINLAPLWRRSRVSAAVSSVACKLRDMRSQYRQRAPHVGGQVSPS